MGEWVHVPEMPWFSTCAIRRADYTCSWEISLCGISGQLRICEGLGSSASSSRGSISTTWRRSAFWPLNLPCVDMSLVGPPLRPELRVGGGGDLAGCPHPAGSPRAAPPAPASVSPRTGFPGWEVSPPRSNPEARLPLGNKPTPAARGSNRACRARRLKGSLWAHLALGCWWNKPFLYIFHLVCHFKAVGAHEWKGPNVLRLSLC